MITTTLEGRLGNQMFQIANCIAHGLRHGMEYAIPDSTSRPNEWPAYFSHFPKLNIPFADFGPYREIDHGYNPIPRKEQVCFMGYWQSYKYFWDFKDVILRAFEPGFAMVDDKEFDYTGRVSIHVRRGDYTELTSKHPPVPLEYLQRAVNDMVELGHFQFTVYSDDPKWCEDNMGSGFHPEAIISVLNEPIRDPVKDALFDFYTMSKHKHNIISNSTFSWWAALLNKNHDKVVISPSVKNWFGPDYKDLNLQHFLLPQWIQIEY